MIAFKIICKPMKADLPQSVVHLELMILTSTDTEYYPLF